METKHKVSWVCIDVSIMNYHYLMYHGNTYIFIESLRLEKAIKINKSNHKPILTMPINQVPQCHISMFIEHFQGRWLFHLPGQPVPIPHQEHCWKMKNRKRDSKEQFNSEVGSF